MIFVGLGVVVLDVGEEFFLCFEYVVVVMDFL